MRAFAAAGLLVLTSFVLAQATQRKVKVQQAAPRHATIHLPSSKQILGAVPGEPQRTNSLPITMAVSPDRRYVAILNAGYGTVASGYAQSIAILDRETNHLRDFPDARLKQRAHQTYFGGLVFSSDGSELYAGMASLSDPKGELPNDTGNGIAVYGFANGGITPKRFIPIAPAKLTQGRKPTSPTLFKRLAKDEASPYPAGMTLVSLDQGAGDGASPVSTRNEQKVDELLVTSNLADQVITILPGTNREVLNIDVGTRKLVPSAYPVNVVATANGRRAWVSLWNESAVAQIDLPGEARNIPLLPPNSPTGIGSHPTALLLSHDGETLYVALTNRDKVAVIDARSGKVTRLLNTQLPGQQYGGAMPVALALNENGTRLFVADAGLDAVAVFDVAGQKTDPLGFIPTEWYPTAIAVVEGELIIASGKGAGTGPNSSLTPRPENAASSTPPSQNAPPRGEMAPAPQHPYVAGLIAGSIARVRISEAESKLGALTRDVLESNLMRGRAAQLPFAAGKNPIKHALYIIKENRTYDQVFGDIKEANGDAALVMYGERITPNQHKLARQFGVLDNFYDSGEVSGDGHVWSTAAIPSDYLERWYPINYRSGTEHTYDGEGFNSSGVPVLEGIPDLDDPGTGYLWEAAARAGITYRDYGEYAAGQWCTAVADEGYVPPPDPAKCPAKSIKKGDPLPANVGQPHGSPSPYPWSIPILGDVVAMKPALRDHVDLRFFPWSLDVPDQLRADEFLNELEGFVRARQQHAGDELPALMIMRLGDDHTSGTRAGKPSPNAAVADNDLAVGRIVEAISHSPYWDDTAIFILEDDAQNGADHVDAHRSTALVISKYSPRSSGKPFVDHTFYTTVNMVRTVEAVVGLPPMNHNDAQASVMAPLFTGAGTQPAFSADYANRDNGLIYQVNQSNAPGARTSARMDFTHADAADANTLNRILWRAAKGRSKMPHPRHTVIPAGAADDDR